MDAKRILIFNVNWLGDVLFSTATIRNIRYQNPGAFIACIIPSRCYQVLKDNPNLDEIIIFDEKDRHRGLFAKIGFIRQLKDKKFDIVYLMHRSMSRALICFLAGIPQRIGYNTKNRGFLLTQKIKPVNMDDLHRIDFYLNIILKAGIKAEDRYTEFIVSPADEKYIDELFKKAGINNPGLLVGVNPGGNWLPKRWPKEYWSDLCGRLADELSAKVIITGSQADRALVEEIIQHSRRKPISVCGELDLKQLGALFKSLDIFISADSGPLHIANAAGAKKIIALFGPTDPLVTGPYPQDNVAILKGNSGCRIPCYVKDCRDNRCMRSIIVEDVVKQVRRFKEGLSNPG